MGIPKIGLSSDSFSNFRTKFTGVGLFLEHHLKQPSLFYGVAG